MAFSLFLTVAAAVLVVSAFTCLLTSALLATVDSPFRKAAGLKSRALDVLLTSLRLHGAAERIGTRKSGVRVPKQEGEKIVPNAAGPDCPCLQEEL